MLISLICSAGFAGTTVPNITDHKFDTTSTDDWGKSGWVTDFTNSSYYDTFNNTNRTGFNPYQNLTNVSTEYGRTNGENFDAEEIGIFIKDNMLYFGLQTDFNLKRGYETSNYTRYYAGDFIFNFDNNRTNPDKTFFGDNRDRDSFAFRFAVKDDNTVNLTLIADKTNTGLNGSLPTVYPNLNYNKIWKISDSSTEQQKQSRQDFIGAGHYTYNSAPDSTTANGLHTIEAAVNLNSLEDNLKNLFNTWAQDYTSVTMYWQPECGNDFLAARSDFSYSPGGNVPEPATLLLFGMGLIGAGALGRKKASKRIEADRKSVV